MSRHRSIVLLAPTVALDLDMLLLVAPLGSAIGR